jgi:hypothetical protein
LARLSNYYIWSLKIRALLRAEGLWELNEVSFSLASFLANYVGENVTTNKLKKLKVLGVKILTMSVKDNLIDIVVEYSNPLAAWAALKKMYQAGSVLVSNSHGSTSFPQVIRRSISRGVYYKGKRDQESFEDHGRNCH